MIAAAGPLLAGVDLDHPSARSDIACVDANAEPGCTNDAWRFISTERARWLAKTEAFRDLWVRFVIALGELGERYVELHGDEVARFLAAPDAGFLPRAPRSSVPTSASVPVT